MSSFFAKLSSGMAPVARVVTHSLNALRRVVRGCPPNSTVDLEAEADAELPMGSTVYPPNIPPTPSAHATHTDTLPSKFAIFDFLEDDINSPPSNRDRLHQNVAYPFTGDVPTRIRAFYRQILAAMPSLRTLPAG